MKVTHSEFFAKNRVSGKYGEIRWNTVTQKNRTTEKQRKPEQTDALRLVCTVIFKYDYGNGAAGTHPLRISQLFKLNVRLKYWNTVEIQWNTVEIRFFAKNSLWTQSNFLDLTPLRCLHCKTNNPISRSRNPLKSEWSTPLIYIWAIPWKGYMGLQNEFIQTAFYLK